MPDNGSRIISKRVGRNVFETRPRVSVVIPAYNSAAFIRDALDSVLRQKFREHEVILVNDGSPDTDRLEHAMHMHRDDIIYIRQKNAGAGVARNTAIEHARGEIIAFLDADDLWRPEFLASQLVFLERHGYDMVYCDATLFGMNSVYRRSFMDTAPSAGECDVNALLDLRCNVITSGTMARKKAIVDAGLFETDRVRAHDFHLWLRMAKNGARIGYQRKQLVRHRVHIDSLSGDSISRAERERDAFERVRRTIELTEEEHRIVEGRIAGLEADLAVEQGKAFLISGEFHAASVAFRVANRHRKSLKLSVILWFARHAPTILLKFFVSSRPHEIAFLPKREKSA